MTWLDRLLSGGLDSRSSADPTLEALCAGLPEDEARALREERAGILEYESAIPRAEAELRAGLRG